MRYHQGLLVNAYTQHLTRSRIHRSKILETHFFPRLDGLPLPPLPALGVKSAGQLEIPAIKQSHQTPSDPRSRSDYSRHSSVTTMLNELDWKSLEK